MNSSKIKNIIGFEKNDYFTNCEMSRISKEGLLLAVNKKFLAFSYKNNGEIIIFDSSKPSKINDNQPRIRIKERKYL